jgi:hypothetical protein
MGFSRLARLLIFPILTSASPALSFTQVHAFVYSHGVFTTLPDPQFAIAPPQFGIVPLPLGISDDGKIVGTKRNFLGFLYEMGHFSTLAAPPQGNTLADPTGINDSGQIVGGAFNVVDNQNVAFYYNGMTYQFINPVFAKGGAVATGINNNGQIVGYYKNPSNKNMGFLKNGNSYSDISDPLGISTFALGIDDAGQILGYYSDGAIDHGFIDSGGVFTTIDDPSATHGTIAYGADHVGAVAGTYFGSVPHGFIVNDPHGFIEENGNYMTLDDPLGADGTEITGINFGGDVVGYYFTANVPEPSTWAMMLVGLAGLGFAGYRRTKKNAKALATVSSTTPTEVSRATRDAVWQTAEAAAARGRRAGIARSIWREHLGGRWLQCLDEGEPQRRSAPSASYPWRLRPLSRPSRPSKRRILNACFGST